MISASCRACHSSDKHVIVVDMDRPQAALRDSIRHLNAGGSLLLYPYGRIEADPGLYPGSRAGDTARMVGQHRTVRPPCAGLVSRAFRCWRRDLAAGAAQSHRQAITGTRTERHFLAATFQMMFPFYRDPTIGLYYGQALCGQDATRRKCHSADGCHLLRKAFMPSSWR